MNTEIQPQALALVERTLQIEWTDGRIDRIPLQALRDACPCATCISGSSSDTAHSSTALPIIDLASAAPISVASVTPVGNYAYAIGFSDGHSSGIYTLENLRELGESQS